MPVSDEQVIQRRVAAFAKHQSAFWKTFKMPLKRYYPNHICGLDIFKFEKEIAKPNREQTTEQAVRAKFGEDAVRMMYELL